MFLVFDLTVAGKPGSRNLQFFGVMHDLDLPVAEGGRHDRQIPRRLHGDVQSPVLARSAYVSFGDYDTTFSDNYVDVLPGEPITITVKSPAPLDELKSSIKITTLTEAYSGRADL